MQAHPFGFSFWPSEGSGVAVFYDVLMLSMSVCMSMFAMGLLHTFYGLDC